MSVIIRGMDMPKSCKECDLLQDYDGDMYCPLNDYLNFGDIENVPDYVMNGCLLVELPKKHGRLIDGDELKTAFPTCDNSKPVTVACVRATINHMPTVIEAEGSED